MLVPSLHGSLHALGLLQSCLRDEDSRQRPKDGDMECMLGRHMLHDLTSIAMVELLTADNIPDSIVIVATDHYELCILTAAVCSLCSLCCYWVKHEVSDRCCLFS